ncbi:unnamed protein product [Cylicocyclus nassatus]|uniref:Uncharacterized protein n=1 Tax=Cylicocyclus nassatus TaxID=53992 RepID=A0AA36MDC1_CYLNA|nr:unnamed protein product [Cylicocyclus nassatus]
MFSARAILLCILLVFIQACREGDARVVKQIAYGRNIPAWRSSIRVRQVQGDFPRLSAFYGGGGVRPQLLNFYKRSEEMYDPAEEN